MSNTQTGFYSCAQCGRADVPDTELLVITDVAVGLAAGWLGSCEDCSTQDGVTLHEGYRLNELRAGTLFRWWVNHVRVHPMRNDEDF